MPPSYSHRRRFDRKLGVQHMWDALWNWPELAQKGGDAVTYFVLAAVGTILFLLRLVFALFGGEGDLDLDGDAHGASDASFTMFSLLSVMAFVMGTGWMGLACRIDWGLGRPVSAVAAVGFGVTMMLLASGLMHWARKLNRDVTYDLETAVGRTARVYMAVPAKDTGQGQVQVSVSGRLMTVSAVSVGPPLAAFASVKVVGVRDDDTLVVEAVA
jgi:hypothetical protein